MKEIADGCVGLKMLDIGNNWAIDDQTVEPLSKLQALTKVDLSHSDISGAGLNRVASNWTLLKELKLTSCPKLMLEGGSLIARYCQGLTSLNLDGSPVAGNLASLAPLALRLTSLTACKVGDKLTDHSLAEFVGGMALPRWISDEEVSDNETDLGEVDDTPIVTASIIRTGKGSPKFVSNNAVILSDPTAISVATAQAASILTRWTFAEPIPEPEDITPRSPFTKVTPPPPPPKQRIPQIESPIDWQRREYQLTHLALGHATSLTDKALVVLAFSLGPFLRRFDISYSANFTDNGMVRFLSRAEKLRWLNMAHCPGLGGPSFIALTNRSLEELNISGNPNLTFVFVVQLVTSLQSLVFFNFEKCPKIGSAELLALQTRFPTLIGV